LVTNIRNACVLIALLSVVAFGQNEPRPIGSIDFFGSSGFNLDQIRSALPLRVGDPFPGPFEAKDAVTKAVTAVIGRPPTDVAPVCCDVQGNYMIFIGLPGSSFKETTFNPVPNGNTKFPPEIVQLYDQTMDAITTSVLQGGAREDDSKGYALSLNDPALRAKQLELRAYALRHETLIRAVLDSASEAKQRIVAAHLLGYARQSRTQIKYLVRASHDADDITRNNATRALGVLAESSPRVAAQIPAGGFIRMLSSGSWTDRNKAAGVLISLTKSRAPKLLAQLRSEALVSLIEMARWHNPGHAHSARVLLARIAGIDEARAQKLAFADNADEIINALGEQP
jgi:hypothetical protein